MTAENTNKPVLALIVPCCNEEDVLPYFKEAIDKVVVDLKKKQLISGESFVVFVDDGSVDSTWRLIQGFNLQFPKEIKGLKLSRNFGHQNALLAGMFSFDFDICVTIDADLQDSPAAIAELIEKYNQGYQIVYGVRSGRDSDSLFKLLTAHIFYLLMRILSIKTVHNHADFRLLSKQAIDVLKNFREVNVFLRGIIPYLGFNSAVVYYERPQRKAGKTKYPFRKMLSFAWEGITSFSVMPLRMITHVGFFIFSLSLLLSVYALIMNYLLRTVPGWTSMALAIYFLGGLIIFFLGIIGEYIGKIYMEVKERPRFIVEEKI